MENKIKKENKGKLIGILIMLPFLSLYVYGCIISPHHYTEGGGFVSSPYFIIGIGAYAVYGIVYFMINLITLLEALSKYMKRKWAFQIKRLNRW